MPVPLRVDPAQQFSCAQCGRCCRRWEIVVSQAEAGALERQGARQWFRESDQAPEGTSDNPFEPIAGAPGVLRIRKRSDGACGFLSPANRCRIHEELGGGRKPLTCRVFPFSFHPAPSAVIVTTSFGCPTVTANQGEPIGAVAAQRSLSTLREEWFSTYRPPGQPLVLVAGRPLVASSAHVIRTHLRRMLDREDGGVCDLRANVRRMAVMLEDLTRVRVQRLPDDAFTEYVALTVPYAAADTKPVPKRPPTRVGRLLQRGFLFAVAATRLRMERRSASRLRLGLLNARLLLHFHGLGSGVERVSLARLRGARLDVNAHEIQPAVHHYLRASIETVDAGDRPLIEAFAIAISILNGACALAIMNANAAGQSVNADGFRAALVEANDLAHADPRGLFGRLLGQLAGGVEALYEFGRV